MAVVDADVWVLTETHLDHGPGPDFEPLFCPEFPGRRDGRERWTAVWSRHPMSPVPGFAGHRRGTVAALIETPAGPLIVYGTVIPWGNEKHFDDGRPARQWEVHRAEIERQGQEWAELRGAFPEVPLIVAGDFNQSRDGSRWYGEQRSRDALSLRLGASGLGCVTEENWVDKGVLTQGNLVDHICVSPEVEVADVHVWERTDDSGQRLSDHPTVAVDVEF
jgi:endonuclease/exonuclease/phosphatase family metal-dependent hydrolase